MNQPQTSDEHMEMLCQAGKLNLALNLKEMDVDRMEEIQKEVYSEAEETRIAREETDEKRIEISKIAAAAGIKLDLVVQKRRRSSCKKNTTSGQVGG